MPTKTSINDVFTHQLPCKVLSIQHVLSPYQRLVNVEWPDGSICRVIMELGSKLYYMQIDPDSIVGMNIYGIDKGGFPAWKETIYNGTPSGKFSIIMSPQRSSFDISDFDEFKKMIIPNADSRSMYMLNGVVCKLYIPPSYDGTTSLCIGNIYRDKIYNDQLFIYVDEIDSKLAHTMPMCDQITKLCFIGADNPTDSKPTSKPTFKLTDQVSELVGLSKKSIESSTKKINGISYLDAASSQMAAIEAEAIVDADDAVAALAVADAADVEDEDVEDETKSSIGGSAAADPTLNQTIGGSAAADPTLNQTISDEVVTPNKQSTTSKTDVVNDDVVSDHESVQESADVDTPDAPDAPGVSGANDATSDSEVVDVINPVYDLDDDHSSNESEDSMEMHSGAVFHHVKINDIPAPPCPPAPVISPELGQWGIDYATWHYQFLVWRMMVFNK